MRFRFRRPQTQSIHDVILVSRNRRIIRHRKDQLKKKMQVNFRIQKYESMNREWEESYMKILGPKSKRDQKKIWLKFFYLGINPSCFSVWIMFYSTIKIHRQHVFRSRLFPWISETQPFVRLFNL